MLKEIAIDFCNGFINSINVTGLLKLCYNNTKFRSTFVKIVKVNALLYLLPMLFANTVYYCCDISIHKFINYFYVVATIFSTIFHVIHYMEIIFIVQNTMHRLYNVTTFDAIACAITISFYQICIIITTNIFHFFVHDNMYYFYKTINLIILIIYHSFYCYNNLWQFLNLDILKRIDIHEKLWPYYFGYATIISIIYLYTHNCYIYVLYNIYMIHLLITPFISPIILPKKTQSYPKIKMDIFSRVSKLIMILINYVHQRI